MMKPVFSAFPIITLSLFLVSCGNTSEDQKTKTSEDTDSGIVANDSSSINLNEDNATSYNLPSPLQIAFVFKKSGAGFISTLPNHTSNTTKYNTDNYKKAVNFGVYSADLSYCLFNKKYQESKEYLKACKDVGSYLGLDKAFESDHMAERFDKNLSNDDSLVKIVSGVQLKTDVMFEENKQKHIKVLALTGAWVESLYIACEVYTKDKNKKIQTSLLEQLLLSETIVKALKNNQSSEPEMAALIVSIEKIHSGFSAIPSVASAMEKEEEIDFNTLTISDADMKPILEAVKTLRTKMIN
ncbi:MAG: hypothetical protein V4506_01760 [Bacteroidota bacterium]